MRLESLHIISKFKNIENLLLNFSDKKGITLLIGNNGSGKSNILEAISSIFAGLYGTKHKTDFTYEIKYKLRNQQIQINYDKSTHTVLVDGVNIALDERHLPSQVVCSYSGEESRLWTEYYEPFYSIYTEELIKGSSTGSKMVYINKYYWNVALATFYMYDFSAFTDLSNFCKNILGINQLNHIKLTFNNESIKTWKNNPVTDLVERLNPDKKAEVQYTVDELRTKFAGLLTGGGEPLFFRYLAAAFLPKGSKIITAIEININNDLSATTLSEGEKKMILVQAVLEIASDENSLILLDEPDSHVHVSRKAAFQKLVSSYENRENVITTHSPTLTHAFDTEHIMLLGKDANNEVIIEPKGKQDIVRQLTDNIWSYERQAIFLSSTNHIVLVEGKTDEIFLKKALEVLKTTETRFKNLDLEYFPCGGASGAKLLMVKFKPKAGQKIIALFDRDKAGTDGINSIVFPPKFKGVKYGPGNYPGSPGYINHGDFFLMLYPKRRYFRGKGFFYIEDYFSKALITSYVMKNFRSLETVPSKEKIKTELADDCNSLNDDEFKHFDVLFDKILEIIAL